MLSNGKASIKIFISGFNLNEKLTIECVRTPLFPALNLYEMT